MAVEFTCKGCSSTLRVADEHLGKQARCPNCQTLNIIQPDEAPADYEDFSRPDWQSSSPHSHRDDLATSTSRPIESGRSAGNPDLENPFRPTATPTYRSYQVPHRGPLVLTLGILSIAMCNPCLILGILAWTMGRSDLQQMEAGVMDRSGEALTRIGMIMGLIITCGSVGMFLLTIVLGILGAVFG